MEQRSRGVTLRRYVRTFNGQIHRLLSVAVLISGLWVIMPMVIGVVHDEHLWWFSQNSWPEVLEAVGLAQLPRVVISLSLLLMSLGLLARARVAWILTLLMLVPAIIISVYTHDNHFMPDAIYNVVLVVLLVGYSGAFKHSSMAAATLFAVASLACLFWYTLLGTLYLGHEFAPKILTLPEGLYFSFVTITTVGYGDIVPLGPTARLFVVSVILLGVTVFASALGAVIVPFVNGQVRHLLQRKTRLHMKKNHVIICGATPLALNLFDNLMARDEEVTVILAPGTENTFPSTADIIVGDASSDEVLRRAGAMQASYVMAVRAQDSDNAFIVLAVKALEGCQAKTVILVNNSQNLEKIRRVKADLVFSPQLFGAEVLSRMMLGEKFDTNLMAELFVGKTMATEGGAPKTPPAT